MSSSNLMRWGGLAAVGGGVLLTVLSILELVLFGGDSGSATVMTSPWIVVEVAYIVAEVLIILGLIGLYAYEAQETGVPGLIAFVAALTGTMLLAGADWGAAFIGPLVAKAAPEVIDADPSGVAMVGFMVTLLLVALGWFLFGLVSLRAGILPRGATILLMAGAVLVLVLVFVELPFESVVLGLAVAWMGYSLWSDVSEQAAIAEVAT